MAKTASEFEHEFIQTASEKTGKSLDQWLSVVKNSGLGKQMEIVNWLKSEYKLNHMQATFVGGIYLNGGKNVYQNGDSLMDNQFNKSEEMRPLFEIISAKIIEIFPETQLIPKKTYLSFTEVREFAAVNIKPKEVRLGIDLGDEPFTELLQKSKLTGPMPRISHMVIISDIAQFNGQILDYIKRSYSRSHKS